MMLRL